MADKRGQSTDSATTRIDRRTLLRGTGAAVTFGGLAGCIGGDDDGGTVQIGAPIPLTGALALGEETENGIRLALEEYEGDAEVDLLVRDSETDPGVASTAATELITEDDVDFLIGGISSASALAIQEVVARQEVPYIAMASSSPLTGENCNRYTYAHHASSSQFSGPPLLGYEQDIYDSMFFLPADFEGGIRARNAVGQRIRAAGAEDAGQSAFQLGNDDYSAQISAIRSSDADIVYFISASFDAVAFLNQARNAGLGEEVDIMFAFISIDLAGNVSDEQLEGIYGGTSFYWTVDAGEEFTSSYRDMFDEAPPWWASTAYDGAKEFLFALEQEDGSTDADAIADRLSGHEFNYSKPCQWRECDNRSIKPMYLLEAKAPSERNDPEDFYRVLGSRTGEGIMRSCDETGCELN